MPDHWRPTAKQSSPEFRARTMKNGWKQRILNVPWKELLSAKTSGSKSARVDPALLLAEQRHGLRRGEYNFDRIELQSHFAAARMSLWNSSLHSATTLPAADYPETELW